MRVNRQLTFQELIRIVSQFARNDRETRLVVADMVNRGIVKFRGRYQGRKVIIC